MSKSILFCMVLAFVGTVFSQTGLPKSNCNCVAFRLDDIQDYYTTAAQTAIIELFKEFDVPLTIGVISQYFGEDEEFVPYLQAAVEDSAAHLSREIEVSSHGYLHEDFSTFTYEEQLDLLNKSANEISVFFRRPTSFIPPFNAINVNTTKALKALNFTHVCSEVDLDPPPYALPNNTNINTTTFWRFPIQAATNVLDIGPFVGVPATLTFSQIQKQLAHFGFAAVMMHPYEFSTGPDDNRDNIVNQTQFDELRKLLTAVKGAGIQIVTLSKIQNYFFDNPQPSTSAGVTTAPSTVPASSTVVPASSTVNTVVTSVTVPPTVVTSQSDSSVETTGNADTNSTDNTGANSTDNTDTNVSGVITTGQSQNTFDTSQTDDNETDQSSSNVNTISMLCIMIALLSFMF